MIEVAIMIEGQDGLDWGRWKDVSRTVEDAGFAGLYRSDHFTNPDGPLKDSLELWTSLTWLAENTERIEFGPLVSPVSFRHPAITAWQASAVDSLSGGRLRLGLGAGWQTREHAAFGFELLDTDGRFTRFTEGLEVITSLLRAPEGATVSYSGEFYTLEAAALSPRSPPPGGTAVVIGGNGPRRTLPLVARYADEWNALFLTPEKFAELSERLDGMLAAEDRSPQEVRRTMMTQVVFGRDEAEVDSLLEGCSREELLKGGLIVGTASEVVEQLGRLEAAGLQKIMLQWLRTGDLDRMEALAGSVLPQL